MVLSNPIPILSPHIPIRVSGREDFRVVFLESVFPIPIPQLITLSLILDMVNDSRFPNMHHNLHPKLP